ncbi:hypothetical protein [Marinovum algicola]|uniref:hypothetical protein n=1 Tax=Marinovum algicola TaxID=42444 RepID=UPI0024B8DBAF|nr:hypothetical protein [Marinovum algicola]
MTLSVRPARPSELRHLAAIEDSGAAPFRDWFGAAAVPALLAPAVSGAMPTSVMLSPPGKVSTALPVPSSLTTTSRAVTGVTPPSVVSPLTSSVSLALSVPSAPTLGAAKPSTMSAPPKSARISVSLPPPRMMFSISVKVAVAVPSEKLPFSGFTSVRSMLSPVVVPLRSSVSPDVSAEASPSIVSLPKLSSMTKVSSL